MTAVKRERRIKLNLSRTESVAVRESWNTQALKSFSLIGEGSERKVKTEENKDKFRVCGVTGEWLRGSAKMKYLPGDSNLNH